MLMLIAGLIGGMGLACMISRNSLLGMLIGVQILILGATMMFVASGIGDALRVRVIIAGLVITLGRRRPARGRLRARDSHVLPTKQDLDGRASLVEKVMMISIETIPGLLLGGLAALLAVGIAVVIFGSKLPRRGDWLVGIPLAYLLVVFGFAWNAPQRRSLYAARVEPRLDLAARPGRSDHGWRYDRSSRDHAGVARGDRHGAVPHRFARALAQELRRAGDLRGRRLSCVDRVDSVDFVLRPGARHFGGFLSLGSRWEEESGSVAAARFAWERCWGVLLSAAGLCIFAGSRGALEFAGAEWSTQAAARTRSPTGSGCRCCCSGSSSSSSRSRFWAGSSRNPDSPRRRGHCFGRSFPAGARSRPCSGSRRISNRPSRSSRSTGRCWAGSASRPRRSPSRRAGSVAVGRRAQSLDLGVAFSPRSALLSFAGRRRRRAPDRHGPGRADSSESRRRARSRKAAGQDSATRARTLVRRRRRFSARLSGRA